MMKNIAKNVYNILKNYYNEKHIKVYNFYKNKIRIKYQYDDIKIEFVYIYNEHKTLLNNIEQIVLLIDDLVQLIYKRGYINGSNNVINV